ncbi:hypothetical protein [Aequorivita sp. Q41]|uniref:hypothetical protein n=1 Tax=Aequorivita sp. Q41 TaxID=3153300 RepID=UPI003242346F
MKTSMYQQAKKMTYCLAALTVMGLVNLSCEKEEGEVPQIAFTPPTAAEYNSLKNDALAVHTEKVTFNAEDGIFFTSNDGATLDISPNCLLKNGAPATGEVELTFIDLYDKKDMLATNKPTMGLKPDGKKAALVSGGEFFIEVRQDGDLLQMGCNYQLIVPGDNTGGADPEMSLWKGIIDANGDLTWDEMEEQDQEIFVEGVDYYIFGNEIGWTNVDRFYNDPREKTTIKVKAPTGFNSENSAVYLSYDGEPNTLAQLDTYDAATGTFSEHYGQIPIGLEVHIIFATADGDNWRYAIQGQTISEDEVYTFTLEETQVDTMENLLAVIQALP